MESPQAQIQKRERISNENIHRRNSGWLLYGPPARESHETDPENVWASIRYTVEESSIIPEKLSHWTSRLQPICSTMLCQRVLSRPPSSLQHTVTHTQMLALISTHISKFSTGGKINPYNVREMTLSPLQSIAKSWCPSVWRFKFSPRVFNYKILRVHVKNNNKIK